jgi:hypothetical protein
MAYEEELTARCQRNDHEPHHESHWIVQWCLQRIGADEEDVRERIQAPWLVLLCLGPIHWLRVTALVCSHSYP